VYFSGVCTLSACTLYFINKPRSTGPYFLPRCMCLLSGGARFDRAIPSGYMHMHTAHAHAHAHAICTHDMTCACACAWTCACACACCTCHMCMCMRMLMYFRERHFHRFCIKKRPFRGIVYRPFVRIIATPTDSGHRVFLRFGVARLARPGPLETRKVPTRGSQRGKILY